MIYREKLISFSHPIANKTLNFDIYLTEYGIPGIYLISALFYNFKRRENGFH